MNFFQMFAAKKAGGDTVNNAKAGLASMTGNSDSDKAKNERASAREKDAENLATKNEERAARKAALAEKMAKARK
jgi:hypothetical protein